MTVSTPMIIMFIVYITGMLLIGYLAYRSTKNFDDYILGGAKFRQCSYRIICGRF
ncbi:Propionate transporter [Providencia rustigianii]|nr:Propionate transporter [Providencia rustigianii]